MAMVADLGMSLVVSTVNDPVIYTAAVRAAVREINPALAIFQVNTMAGVIEDSLWQLNLYRMLIGLFAVLALVLAAIGLYGVIAYTTAARTREFAVRLALGCRRGALARLVMLRAAALAGGGIVLGSLAIAWLRDALGSLGIGGVLDVATVLLICGLVLAVTAGASAIPALRACALDPVDALRHE
jgi:ABC-type antimicrobial peptide transport system permease subunit